MDYWYEDIAFLAERFDTEQSQKPKNERSNLTLIERLNYVLNNNFVRLSYTEAIEILQNSKHNKKNKFQYPIDGWGVDLQSRSEEHTSELQSRGHLVCRLLLEKKKKPKSEQ